MTTINLPVFPGSQFMDVYRWLLPKRENRFRIILPRPIYNMKQDQKWSSVNEEYAYAAYAAELLSKAVTNFAYNVPCPYMCRCFVFDVETVDMERFSDTLYELLCAFNKNYPRDAFNDFHKRAIAFAGQEYGQGKNIAATGLLV